MKTLLLVGAMVLASKGANAQELPELTRVLSEEIAAFQAAEEPTLYTFKQFLVRVQLSAGIEVPWTAKLQVVPEVELLWQKD